MKLILEPRAQVSPGLLALTLTASLAAGFVVVGVVFALMGVDPLFALSKILLGGFGSAYSLGETLTKSIPLLLIGVGLCLPFTGKFWNIGAEGQLLAGAIITGWSALTWAKDLPPWLMIPVLFILAAVAGAFTGLIPAVLKQKWGVNEVISTLMLNYIMQEFLKFLITGPLRGVQGQVVSNNLPDAALLASLPGTRIHWLTLALGLLAAVALFFLLKKSKLGYEIRVIGENREAARYAGINFLQVTVVFMLISGALAGMAGYGEVGGIHQHLLEPLALSSGYGFTAIIVAWLARLNPLSVIFSAFFFAGILVGGDAVQLKLGLPAATVNVVNGILLLALIAGEYFLKNRLRLRRPSPEVL